MAEVGEITDALVAINQDRVLQLVEDFLKAGVGAGDILNNGLIKGMGIVGKKMEAGDMFIPEVLKSAKIMSMAVEILKPHLSDEAVSSAGKVVIGTVKGDLHDIGKNLVMIMLQSSGFEVIDMGVDVSPDAFVSAAQENTADIIALSALLTTTMPMMKETIDTISASGLRDSVKILVGGAPVNQTFADEIGADGYAPDAGSATKLAKRFSPSAN